MKKNVAGQKIRFSLFKQGARIAAPTIVAGDAKVDLDGAGQANVNTLPTSDAAGLVTWSPTQAETNADVVSLLMNDAAGAQWDPVTIVTYTELETSVASILDDTGTSGVVVSAASLATISAAVWAAVAEGAHTYADVQRIMLAVLSGRSMGGGSNTISFRDVANAKDRVRVQVDANGNRVLVITLDGT